MRSTGFAIGSLHSDHCGFGARSCADGGPVRVEKFGEQRWGRSEERDHDRRDPETDLAGARDLRLFASTLDRGFYRFAVREIETSREQDAGRP